MPEIVKMGLENFKAHLAVTEPTGTNPLNELALGKFEDFQAHQSCRQ